MFELHGIIPGMRPAEYYAPINVNPVGGGGGMGVGGWGAGKGWGFDKF